MTTSDRSLRWSRRYAAVHSQMRDARNRFLRNKRREWDEYRKQVTPFERERYLPVL